MNTKRLMVVASACALALVAMLALNRPAVAQLSCDNPPLDVSRLSSVWNLTDFCTYTEGVFDEILSGGVPRDGIPPIDDPSFESVSSAEAWLQAQAPVISLVVNEAARAYPLGILTRHEIVNDVVDGLPLAVTFCPLCNSALVYERTLDGEVLRFGVSGLLRNSDLVMWDDQTQSWWQQLTGEGIVGAYTGRELVKHPSQVVSFGAFAAAYPDGEVLSAGARGFNTNPYVGYDSDPNPFLFRGASDPRLPATERVLAGVILGEAFAYPFSVLSVEQVVNDSISERPVVVLWQAGATSALDQAAIDQSRDVGMATLYNRTLDDGRVLSFALDAEGRIVDDLTGSAWNIFGQATAGELQGTQLAQEFAAPHFWFAWAAFRPQTSVYAP